MLGFGRQTGDTGMMPAFQEIGEKLGPFDVTLMQIGAYGDAWPDWHLTPEQAITAHSTLRGGTLLPVHWGLFNLAYHSWREPIDRLMRAGAAQQITIVTPRPGEAITIGSVLPTTSWWAGATR
ncbi:MBL fold metallo-hydrolase [Gemmatimonas sp.]|uniref:MBL fold metallo-hydrolase n=1 Tax=Gemmatimonas sp. TaxID=1962908 RepID=UPI00286B4D72|nr:MBL fold metallo-hydrolase [Gemmatimonas sp.]